jgi:hypothetical protein
MADRRVNRIIQVRFNLEILFDSYFRINPIRFEPESQTEINTALHYGVLIQRDQPVTPWCV